VKNGEPTGLLAPLAAVVEPRRFERFK